MHNENKRNSGKINQLMSKKIQISVNNGKLGHSQNVRYILNTFEGYHKFEN
jgi:hypothetical protein